jgi:hypothetical protein
MDMEIELKNLEDLLVHTCRKKRSITYGLYAIVLFTFTTLAVSICQSDIFILLLSLINVGSCIFMVECIKQYKIFESEIRKGIADAKQLIVQPIRKGNVNGMEI